MKRSVPRIPLVLPAFLVLVGWCGADVPTSRPASSPAGAGSGRAAVSPRRPSRAEWAKWVNRFPPPIVRRIPIPDFPGAHAIWGGTGTDSRGHVWFGVSAHGVDDPSAHLFEFVPGTGEVIDRGDVVSQLKRCGIYRPGEGQMKIHTKIIQLDDGHLYFASMDEQNENLSALKLPTWGSHLWRLRLPERGPQSRSSAIGDLDPNRWEHLMSTQEALIAAAGGGKVVYALGYFGHVLYQYDCRTGRSRSVKVGAAGAHISRNFFTDRRGHVYVPRVRQGPGGRSTATLVEFDPSLREVAASPLRHYAHGSAKHSHGIIGFQPLDDGRIAFLTHTGYLYLLVPPGEASDAPSELKELGWFHPRGSCYAPSLFADPGGTRLMGLTCRDGRYDWVTYSIEYNRSVAAAFTLRGPKPLWHRRSLLYGSVARDQAGNFYVGGRTPREKEGFGPVLLQVCPSWRQEPSD